MDANDRKNDPLRRCFIVAPPGPESARLARIFAERGVETFRAEEIVAGAMSEEIIQHLAAADFVVASLNGNVSPALGFEIGVAYTLHKPILIFTTNYDKLFADLRSVYVVKAAPEEVGEVASEVDHFLRHAISPPPIGANTSREQRPGNFTWARERAAALKRERGASRGLAFEQLVSEIFQKAGGQVLETKAGADRGGDLIVWQNDIAFETGGPMLVECKHYGGRSGSIVANARHTVERLEKLVRASDARLALLVLSYDLAKQPPHIFETPWF